MKLTHKKLKPGMTLIELTVVILVLLTLISVLFIGAQAYKRGADRAACILNIRNAQQAMRAEMNVNESKPGGPGMLQANIIGTGKYVETVPTCPGTTADYTILSDGNYPALGVAATTASGLYIFCNIVAADGEKHYPKSMLGW